MRRKPLSPPPPEVLIDPVRGELVARRLRNKGRQGRHVLTVNGRVKLVRRWWQARRSGSLVPVDALIDPQQQTVSPGVREMACRLNNGGVSFDRAAQNLARSALICMSGEQLRQVVIAEGRAVLSAQEAGAIPTAFQAHECVISLQQSAGPTRLYTGCDGVMVPLVTDAEKVRRRTHVRQKRQRRGRKCRPLPPRRHGADRPFKEFKTVVFYDEHGRHWHEVLSRRPRKRMGALLRREASRLGFARADERIANVDGADWIRTQLMERPHELPLDGLGLDFYHLSENVHRCRRTAFGEQNAAGQAWADALLHSLKHAGYEAAWEELQAWRASLRSPRKRAAADRLLHYIFERREMINYPAFQNRGWQIGSGPTESRCKTSTHRLKGRGRRWDPPHAEAVAALTTLEDSHQWHLYWKTLCLLPT
jgi:hypothetical protein